MNAMLKIPVGAVAVAAPSIVVAADQVETDPIFAAIERHRLAWADLNARVSALTEASEAGDAEAGAEIDRLHNANSDAALELINVIPTTRPGLLALLRYHQDFVGDGSRDFPDIDDEADDRHCRPLSFFLIESVIGFITSPIQSA